MYGTNHPGQNIQILQCAFMVLIVLYIWPYHSPNTSLGLSLGLTRSYCSAFLTTPGSMNALFSDLFKEMLEGDFRGRSGLFGGDWGRFLEEIEWTYEETARTTRERNIYKNQEILFNTIK